MDCCNMTIYDDHTEGQGSGTQSTADILAERLKMRTERDATESDDSGTQYTADIPAEKFEMTTEKDAPDRDDSESQCTADMVAEGDEQVCEIFSEARGGTNIEIWASNWIDGLVYIDGERSLSVPKKTPCTDCFHRQRACLFLDREDLFFHCLPSEEIVCCNWCMRGRGLARILLDFRRGVEKGTADALGTAIGSLGIDDFTDNIDLTSKFSDSEYEESVRHEVVKETTEKNDLDSIISVEALCCGAAAAAAALSCARETEDTNVTVLKPKTAPVPSEPPPPA